MRASEWLIGIIGINEAPIMVTKAHRSRLPKGLRLKLTGPHRADLFLDLPAVRALRKKAKPTKPKSRGRKRNHR